VHLIALPVFWETLGVIAGRRRSRAASQQAIAEQVGNFKKAFSVCLEAKEYMVKY
jgi:hypothetical protein